MTCREVTEFLNDYLSQELPPRQREEFERHLAACRDCAAFLDSYKQTIAFARQAFVAGAEVAEQVPDELVQAILTARRSNP